MFLEAILHGSLAQAVTFLEPMGQIAFDFAAKHCQDFDQDGGRADAINVIIAEDDDRLGVAARLEQTVHGTFHPRNEEGIGEVLEAGVKKAVDLFGFGQSTIEEALGEEWRDVQGLRQLGREGGMRIRA